MTITAVPATRRAFEWSMPWRMCRTRWHGLRRPENRGHHHAGIRIVREGATLIPTLDAHALHPGVFTEADLTGFATATAPESQLASQQRHGVMKKPVQKKLLLNQLEARILNPSD